MNTEELELLADSKYRNYVAAVDKALKNFEYSSEWADLISALGKLNKVLHNNAKYQVVPKKLTIGKRLAQCLHPALPSGVHRKALETYEIIFKIIGPKRLAKDLFLYSSGLFPLLTNAAMSVKPALLCLYEVYYLPLGKTLKPGLQGLLTGVLPGLEEGSEYYDRTNALLEKVAAAVEQSAFYSALWGSILTSPAVRLPGVTFVLFHLNRKLCMEDQLYIVGSDIELMVEAVSTSVQDSSVLVQRSTLDLILFCFPFHMSQATRTDMIRILSAALHVVLRRDMSLNRRLYAWLLGFDNNCVKIGPRSTRHSNPEEHATYYFNTFSKDMLVQAMVGILQGKAVGGEEESVLMHDVKPFRILISLLDKPELGPAILEDVLIEVFRTLHSQCKAELDLQTQSPFCKDHTQLSSKLRENKKTAELIKTANLLFNSFEPYYMWDYIARWFEECCRRTLNARLQGGPGGISEASELSLVEFCQLVDFLLDIVSLETYIEIQTEHLPQLLLRMVSALTSHLQALGLAELTDCLRLCSKILSKVQPPLVSPEVEGSLPFTAGQPSPARMKEENKIIPVSLENANEVFEDSENPPSSRSSESGFTEFVQYQANKSEDLNRAPGEGHGVTDAQPVGSTSSEMETASTVGSEDTVVHPSPTMGHPSSSHGGKAKQKTVIQCCLEYFQQFLTRLIALYITPCTATTPAFTSEFGSIIPVSLENANEVFEDSENPPSSRSSESGFTEFVQYQANKSEDLNRAPGEGHGVTDAQPVGSTSSEMETASTVGSEDTVVHPSPTMGHPSSSHGGKAKQKTVIQCCLEYFQQFLTRLIALYITPCTATTPAFTSEFGSVLKGDSPGRGGMALGDAASTRSAQRECLGAFTATCQLFLECSSFPVYIAEGNLKPLPQAEESTQDSEQVKPPLWLQNLMDACCLASEFSIQAVAISLVMDLVGLTQSVTIVTGENVNSLETAQPMSPSQGRVAVVIRPPLTQGILRFIAEKTAFFKHVALTLWDQLGEGTPQHHQRSVELFYQLHNLAPSSSICEGVISQQLMHRDKKIRLEAHVKFSVLWHLTRDLNINKSSPFNRTFDRQVSSMVYCSCE
ncbi:UNVERIFIED_CONTAM: hypothetical protein FKN15_057972 [Acipenser sinensis]